MTGSIILGVCLLCFVLVIWIIYIYNVFIKLGNKSKEAWSDIDVQLKRRYDLIPGIVDIVKGYALHEKETFRIVTEARTNAMSAQKPEEKGKNENALTGALKSVFAVAEDYPALKANQNFLALQAQLVETENTIQAARRYYNGNVRDLNIALESFPGNIVAGIFNFKKMEFFNIDESEPEARKPSGVNF